MGALRHRIGNDSVNSNCGENQRDRREDRNEKHVEAWARDRFFEALLGGAHVVERLLSIERPDFLADGAEHGGWFARGLNNQGESAPRRLTIGSVELSVRFLVQADPADVTDDADHGVPLRVFRLRIAEGQPFSDRILTWKIFLYQSLANNDAVGRAGHVTLIQKPAAPQRDLHRS